MPGVLLWGWDDTNKVWVKLQVDANGLVKVDMSAVNLNDLADVSVAAPADDDLFYYDDATGLWKSRKLVDADIPAAIARDAEVTAAVADEATARDVAIAAIKLDDLADVRVPAPADQNFLYWDAVAGEWTYRILIDADIPAAIARDAEVATAVSDHAALTTGVHGVGASYIAKTSRADQFGELRDADGDTKVDVEEAADEDKIRMDVAGVEAFLLNDDGILNLAKQSVARAYRATSTQTVHTGTDTKIQLNAESYDVQSEFDSTTNYRFVAKQPGYYVCTGIIKFGTAVDGKRYAAEIWKNGAQHSLTIQFAAAAATILVSVTDIVHLNTDEFVELYAWHEQGSDNAVQIGEAITWMAIGKIA